MLKKSAKFYSNPPLLYSGRRIIHHMRLLLNLASSRMSSTCLVTCRVRSSRSTRSSDLEARIQSVSQSWSFQAGVHRSRGQISCNQELPTYPGRRARGSLNNRRR
ncbi:hypothetical protein AG1IA_00362 [Rhizoctonia solani AG-1 IA]|uniref:Uncharacterized protein n=1 Tax=Thanatephorus cucumeris (strain AG1-IA) TaxID=983506 RepID=L8X929_THACA|nr:hypothetical protein AG1IA_00362 [Rhizoctonia solani AG-1 IA]